MAMRAMGKRTPVITVLGVIGASMFLGEVGDAYERFWWWDAVLHTGSRRARPSGIVRATVFAAFGVFFLISSPAEAARLVKVTGENAGEWFETVGAALTKFLKTLV